MRPTKKFVKDGLSIYREAKYKRWCVRIAPRKTPTGKEQRVRFADADHNGDSQQAYHVAVVWMEERAGALTTGGTSSFLLSPHEQQTAHKALEKLTRAGVSITLTALADYYLARERPAGGVIDLATAIENFKTTKTGVGRSEHYVQRILDPVKQLARDLAPSKSPKETPHGSGLLCNRITPEMIKVWLYETKSNLTQNGRRHYQQDLTIFFQWLVDKQHLAENPCDRLDSISRVPTQTGILTVPQCRLLLDAARDYELVAPVVCSLFASARPKELTRLTWDDIHLDKDPVLIFEGAATKKKHRRVVQLKPNAVAWLMTCPTKKGPILPRPERLRELHRRLKKLNPGQYDYPHDGLRHSFASYALPKFGLDWALRAMGHVGDANTFHEHYKALVRPPQEELFWSLTPDDNSAKNVVPMPSTATA